MLGSILSVGYREAGDESRGWRIKLASVHTLGLGVSAVLWGGLLGLAGTVLGDGPVGVRIIVALMVFVALAYTPRELGFTQWPSLLESPWQVPLRWARRMRASRLALSYGLGLGPGFGTRLVTANYYLLVLWSLLADDPVRVALIWFSYALARAGALWWLALAAPPGNPIPFAFTFAGRLSRHMISMMRANAAVMVATMAFGVLRWMNV